MHFQICPFNLRNSVNVNRPWGFNSLLKVFFIFIFVISADGVICVKNLYASIGVKFIFVSGMSYTVGGC